MRHVWKPILLAVLLVPFLAGCPLPDNVLVVDLNAADGGDGRSWDGAFNTIQPAIDKAAGDAAYDTIWVAQGTYDEVRDNADGSLLLAQGVNVYGGFKDGQTKFTSRNARQYITVIDGSVARAGQQAYHVVQGAPGVTLDGFTVRGGNAHYHDDSGGNVGAGLYIPYAAEGMTVSDCIFEDNRAGGGAGANSSASNTVFKNCLFRNNLAELSSAGLGMSRGANSVVNCIFWNNEDEESPGAALCAHLTAVVDVVNCTFTKNRTHQLAHAGGISAVGDDAVVNLKNCIVFDNYPGEIYPYWGGTVNATYSNIRGGYTGTGNRTVDPMFVDAEHGNVRLDYYSLCIDIGTADGAPTDDYDFQPRPLNRGYDMGAFEHEEGFIGIRIGDKDGFGWETGLQFLNWDPPVYSANEDAWGAPIPCNIDNKGLLGPADFLPDMDAEGGTHWSDASIDCPGDDWDNRGWKELTKTFLMGCGFEPGTPTPEAGWGSHFTDITVSRSYDRCIDCLPGGPGDEFPTGAGTSDNGLSNQPGGIDAIEDVQPGFVFDFYVEYADIDSVAPLYLNVVFGDYEVDLVKAKLTFNSGEVVWVDLTAQPANMDGLIQSAFAVLTDLPGITFSDIFEDTGDRWHGVLKVAFKDGLATGNIEPFTAFDYAEISVNQDSIGIIRVPLEYPTIQAAIDAADTGNTVIVAPGDYPENIHFDGKNITVRSQAPQDMSVRTATRIIGVGGSGLPIVTFDGTEYGSCALLGFTITGGSTNNGGGIQGNGTAALIAFNDISGNTASGDGGGVHGCTTVIGNHIFDNLASQNGGGLYGCATVERNYVYRNVAGADGGGVYGGWSIVNNVVFGNTASDSFLGGGIRVPDGQAAILQHNTVVYNHALCNVGIHAPAGAVENSIVWGSPTDWALRNSVGSYHDCIFQGAPDIALRASNNGCFGNDPLFVSPGDPSHDYRLSASSPAIDTGVVLSPNVNADVDGMPRNDGAPDIGAYEYTE
ncbi:MAG TPA: choice-of-anchor Q domain-containing protein [Candidatus Hydrogenedentes bacterium]|nr:choice-of-anchor Q domain-containing protein [Candidatus Hydrogenedentota bacterium]HPG69254.1 choice-of-anchor Q domain-containing protein [Candidatus Hydrogenedentota bacterium]